MNKAKHIKTIIFLIIISGIYMFILRPYDNKTHNEAMKIAKNKTIAGELIDVIPLSKGGSEFVLKNSAIRVKMYLYSRNYNEGKLFWEVAQSGDSVYKAKGSDTLFLYKSNKVIPFVIY